jgi:glutamate/aspartate transport system substrate-binding protein
VFQRSGKFLASALSAIFCITPGAQADSDTLGKIRKNQTLVIAFVGVVSNGRSPFARIAEDGKVEGYAIDICTRIAEGIKRDLKLPALKIEFLPVNAQSRFDAVIENKADLECSVTTNNAERREKVAFTVPHFFTSVRMLVRKNSGIRDWPDLRDRKAATTRGTAIVKIINARNDARALNVRIDESGSDAEAAWALEKGRVDAFVMDEVLLISSLGFMEHPEDFEIVGAPLSVEPYCIMMRKDDPAFRQLVGREMAKMAHDGEIRRLYQKWFMRPIGSRQVSMDVPMNYLLRDSLLYPSDKVLN